MDPVLEKIVVTLPGEDVAEIRQIAATGNVSRDEIIRRAIAQYIQQNRTAAPKAENPFGLWKRRGLTEDGLAYQERIRAEW